MQRRIYVLCMVHYPGSVVLPVDRKLCHYELIQLFIRASLYGFSCKSRKYLEVSVSLRMLFKINK